MSCSFLLTLKVRNKYSDFIKNKRNNNKKKKNNFYKSNSQAAQEQDMSAFAITLKNSMDTFYGNSFSLFICSLVF